MRNANASATTSVTKANKMGVVCEYVLLWSLGLVVGVHWCGPSHLYNILTPCRHGAVATATHV